MSSTVRFLYSPLPLFKGGVPSLRSEGVEILTVQNSSSSTPKTTTPSPTPTRKNSPRKPVPSSSRLEPAGISAFQNQSSRRYIHKSKNSFPRLLIPHCK